VEAHALSTTEPAPLEIEHMQHRFSALCRKSVDGLSERATLPTRGNERPWAATRCDVVKRFAKSLVPGPQRAWAKRLMRRLSHARFVEPYVWETLSDPSLCGAAGQYAEARTDLVELIKAEPRRVIDLGCGNGATAAAVKHAFPAANVMGVERNPAAAHVAAGKLDRVITASIENLDYDVCGVEKGSIDAALILDVLEHLYDPWDVLRRLRPRLSAHAQVVASIPNARNFWLLSHLLDDGAFRYEPNGLLDITHIRFFTRREIESLFSETGYRINRLLSHFDERVPDVLPVHEAGDGAQQKFVLRNLSDDDAKELRTLQFYVVACPA
jgi:trans-aconitate methyltransferase